MDRDGVSAVRLHAPDAPIRVGQRQVVAGGRVLGDALRRLDTAGVPVVLAAGRRDRVPVPGLADQLAARHPRVRVVQHPAAGHDLPLSDPDWCVRSVQPDRGEAAAVRRPVVDSRQRAGTCDTRERPQEEE